MSALTPDGVLLGLLALAPQHGYELLECFRNPDQLGRVWNLSTSQLYAVLKRLERAGWIVGHEAASENAPTRTEYTLTEAGKKRLHDWLNDPQPSASIRRVRVEFLSRLYIAQQLHTVIEPIVWYQREACERKLTELLAERENVKSGIGLLALELHIRQLEAVLGWMERCEIMPSENHAD
jgi:DNA-binding PadR family transcriptional regulator